MENKKSKLYLFSNMYPSEKDLKYGIFVKHMEEAIQNYYSIEKIVITKKHSLLSKIWGYLSAYCKGIKLLFTSTERDIIYVHFPLYFSPLVLLWKLFYKNVYLNFHGSDSFFETPLKKILSVLMFPVVKKCRIVVPSKSFRLRIAHIFSVDVKQILVYPSGGIDQTIFFRKTTKENPVFVIGFVSNFIPSKGWKTFLKALQLLEEKKLRYHAIMIGEGPDNKKILTFIHKQQLNVEVVDSITQDALAKWYNVFDVFVFSTERESLGLVGLEAMACGTPVIASNVEGPTDYVKHLYNGLLFKRNDEFDLAEKIMLYHTFSTEKKVKLEERAMQTAKKFESSKIKRDLIRFIDNAYIPNR